MLGTLPNDVRDSLWVALQRGLPLVTEPFAALGRGLGLSGPDVIAEIERLFEDGKARRLGAAFDLRRIGYRSALCAVCTTEADRYRIVPAVTAEPGVTHCYRRRPIELFPYDLYAMIHGGSWEETLGCFDRISEQTGLRGGRVMFSLKEYKKTSPEYFRENTS